jgi:hypothetical protein
MYLSPLWVIFVYLIFYNKNLPSFASSSNRFIGAYLLFLVLVSSSNLLGNIFSTKPMLFRSVQEVLFVLSPAVTSWLLFIIVGKRYIHNKEQIMNVAFFTLAAASIVESLIQIYSGGHKGNKLSDFNIINFIIYSQSATESSITSFGSGFFALYFFNKGQKKKLFFAFLLILIGSKRIVLASVLVGIVLLIVFRQINKKLTLSSTKRILLIAFALVANLIYLRLTFLLTEGYFDEICMEIFGIPPNWLLQGRVSLFSFVVDEYNKADLYIQLFGENLGSASNLLQANETETAHVHSDILKNLYDMGFVGLTVWLVLLYRMNTYNIAMLVQVIYMNFIFFTDNIFLYNTSLLSFYLCTYAMYLDTAPEAQIEQT